MVRLRPVWMTNHLLQCFDAVGWVIRPVKRRLQNDLNTVSSGTLNVAQSINQAAMTPFAKLLSPLILLSSCYCNIIITSWPGSKVDAYHVLCLRIWKLQKCVYGM